MERMEFEKNVSELRQNYNKSYSEKERLAKHVSEISKQINQIISEVKAAKIERNKTNDEIKRLKTERNKINDEVRSLVEKAKTFEIQNQKLGPSASGIKRQIEDLNMIVITEALSFNKEKEVQKKINVLKKQYASLTEAEKNAGNFRELNKQIRKRKDEAKKIHFKIEELANKSEIEHKKVLELSRKVDELKETEKKTYDEFRAKKNECLEFEKKLRLESDKSREIKKNEIAQRKINTEKKKMIFEKREESKRKTIEQKSKEVEEKFKKDKKLTTEDLIIMQGKDR